MKYELSKEDYQRLKVLQRNTKLSRRRYRKVTVLVMLHQGFSIEMVEGALGLDDNTIRRYWEGYQSKGIETYLADHYVPYTGKLTNEEKEQLSEHLNVHLYLEVKPIISWVAAQFGVTYSISGMRDLLHRLGFVYKKTKAIPSRAEERLQLDFLDNELPGLLRQVEQGRAVVYFSDGCHPTHNTKTGRGWIRKGQDFEVDCNSGRKRVNINAAVNALKPEHLVYDLADSINAQSTQRLCRQLIRKHPRKTIYLICDNARYNRNKSLQHWAAGQRVEFVFLPAYSPNLNIIERLWRLMRKEVIDSIYYDTYAKFRQGIIDFLDKAKLYKHELRSLLALNFRTVGGTSVYPQTTS
ncbi:MAG: IS630 family transposase [Bacteroidota bacterium]